jgi:hypothetical protein
MSAQRLDHAHGANKNGPGATKKKGGNKGIKSARQVQKRVEAEARNSRTPYERTRRYRLAMTASPAVVLEETL